MIFRLRVIGRINLGLIVLFVCQLLLYMIFSSYLHSQSHLKIPLFQVLLGLNFHNLPYFLNILIDLFLGIINYFLNNHPTKIMFWNKKITFFQSVYPIGIKTNHWYDFIAIYRSVGIIDNSVDLTILSFYRRKLEIYPVL